MNEEDKKLDPNNIEANKIKDVEEKTGLPEQEAKNIVNKEPEATELIIHGEDPKKRESIVRSFNKTMLEEDFIKTGVEFGLKESEAKSLYELLK